MADSSRTSATWKDSKSPDETKKAARSGTQPEVKVEAYSYRDKGRRNDSRGNAATLDISEEDEY